MIRALDTTYIEMMRKIECEAQVAPWSEAIFHSCFSSRYQALGYFSSPTLLSGFAWWMQGPYETHLLNLAVDPKQQGQGIGQQLLNVVIQASRALENIEAVFLEVRSSNSRAIKLYENSGFIQSGERRNYYPATANRAREDALLMALPIIRE